MRILKFNESSNIDLFKKVSDELSNKLNCDEFGSCTFFAEDFVREIDRIDTNLLNEFKVIEGWVLTGGDPPREAHTWIELSTGEKLDPTLIQFGRANYEQSRKEYTGKEYLDLVKGLEPEEESYRKRFYKN